MFAKLEKRDFVISLMKVWFSRPSNQHTDSEQVKWRDGKYPLLRKDGISSFLGDDEKLLKLYEEMIKR